MRKSQPPSRDGAQRSWKLPAVAALAVATVAVAAPQAPAQVKNGVPHMLERILEAVGVLQESADAIETKADGIQSTADAIRAKTDNIPASPPSSSDTGTILTDVFRETENSLTSRDVEGTEGKQFLANFTVHCSFGTPDGNTDLNTASVSLRLATPTGDGPFLTTFRERSTDRIVTLVTGPVAGFDGDDATYHVSCTPGGSNSFSQAMAQGWFQVVP